MTGLEEHTLDGESIPEFQAWLLYRDRAKEQNKCEEPMTFEQWQEWKRNLATADQPGREI